MTTEVYVVMPADVDDATRPSGGNTYDRRVCDGLAAAGRRVHEVAVPGGWPRPDAAARAELGTSLAAMPDGAVVLLDGLVAGGVPEVVGPEAGRLRQVVLMHLPLGAETGLAPALAAELDALERKTLHAVGSVVATSAWAAGRMIEHHGLAADRVHLATPGTDPAPLASGTDGGSRLLCVGSVTPTKGQDLLVEALAAVADLAWTCECVGALHRDPAHVTTVRRLVEHHGLGDRVRLAGPRTADELAATYAATDLLVLPSRAESYGMVVTEALARGIPALAAAVDGVPDTLGRSPDGEVPGVLVPPGDPAALAAALRRWFGEPELRRRLRLSARARRDGLAGWAATTRQLAEALDRLAGGSA